MKAESLTRAVTRGVVGWGLFVLFTSLSLAETTNTVQVGYTMDEVRAILGNPKGNMSANGKGVWLYERGTVDFLNGKVVSASIMDDAALARRQAEKVLREKTQREEDQRKDEARADVRRAKYTPVRPGPDGASASGGAITVANEGDMAFDLSIDSKPQDIKRTINPGQKILIDLPPGRYGITAGSWDAAGRLKPGTGALAGVVVVKGGEMWTFRQKEQFGQRGWDLQQEPAK